MGGFIGNGQGGVIGFFFDGKISSGILVNLQDFAAGQDSGGESAI